MSKPLNKLTEQECFNISQDMLSNSIRRWKSAELLAMSEDYGGAISSHITSIEEQIKGFIMFLDSKGFEFRSMEGMDSIIRRSHSIRHFIGFVMFVLNIFLDDFKKFMPQVIKEPSMMKEFVDDKTKWELKIKWYFLRKILIIEKELHWFSQIEKFRQTGNHVDYDSQAKSPLEINKEDYLEVSVRLTNVKNVLDEFIKIYSIEDEELICQIKQQQLKLKKDNIYKRCEGSLLNVTKGKKSPFDLVAKMFR